MNRTLKQSIINKQLTEYKRGKQKQGKHGINIVKNMTIS